MKLEAKIIKFIGGHLPPIPHSTAIINRILKPIYLRKKRPLETVKVFDFRMKLDPSECVDGGLFFYPHLYERREAAFIKKTLKLGDVFIDLGANIGFYSLYASRLVGHSGQVLAIEADADNAQKLRENIQLNQFENIRIAERGISDKKETLLLYKNIKGNNGGHTFLKGIHEENISISVDCYTFLETLQEYQINKIAFLKIDIEGFEYKVLSEFFRLTSTKLVPSYIMMEKPRLSCSNDPVQLIENHNYKKCLVTSDNIIFAHSSSPLFTGA